MRNEGAAHKLGSAAEYYIDFFSKSPVSYLFKGSWFGEGGMDRDNSNDTAGFKVHGSG